MDYVEMIRDGSVGSLPPKEKAPDANRDMARQSGGIITSKEIRRSNIPTVYLSRMVEDGNLIRVDRGMYMDPSGDYDEYYFFSHRFKVAVFSYVSSLYLQGLTDIIPNEMEFTVYRGYNPHCMNGDVRIHYVTKEIHGLGITEGTTMFGNNVKAYDLERTICDFIKKRNEIETELFSKIINNYVRCKNKDMNRLYEYSKQMKIYRKVKELMEVFYE